MGHSLPPKGSPQLQGLGCGVRVKRSHASPRPPRNRVGIFRLERDHPTPSSPAYRALNFETETPEVSEKIEKYRTDPHFGGPIWVWGTSGRPVWFIFGSWTALVQQSRMLQTACRYP
jgi:hypothetical protein